MAMKPALRSYLDEHPRIKAVFVGTRRTDPHGKKLTHFDETDGDWPRFMRIHPVVDWCYVAIWAVSLLHTPHRWWGHCSILIETVQFYSS